MARYINADKLIELLRDECAEVDDGNRDIDESTCLMTFRAMHEFVNKIPTADVQPVISGEWIPQKGVLHRLEIDGICSECGYVTGFYRFFNYCPNCGARMVEDK